MLMRSVFARTVVLASLATGVPAAAAPLSLTVYNPGTASIFPVSSEILSGPRGAILIDAQFQSNDARKLVRLIRATHRRLQAIYISHSDPDYYFGLGILHRAFPEARIVATPETVAAIRVLKNRKLRYWGPVLGKNAPKTLIVPEALKGNRLMLDGHRILIEGLNGPTPTRSYVYIPSLRTVVGGAVVFSGTHVWVADTQTLQARADWRATLRSVLALHPLRVVPGHYLGRPPKGVGAVLFTEAYLRRFDKELARAADAKALIAAMENAYPGLPKTSWLALGAKVVKGDMVWPQ
ncbi:MAG: MBL fold metallo-hydrolase [Proteobacteria bacterium]|nr:MBL fold metallo-hydrolase [Pseudomonadota bacterium]